MSRPHRVALGGYVYHVLNRANGRLPIFQKDADYAAFGKERGKKGCQDPFLLTSGGPAG
jgi:hypothetical protein